MPEDLPVPILVRRKTAVKKARTGRAIRTGCQTCKLRKIKCDEGRPACQRCDSTGRICAGYGIWGGGGRNAFSHWDGNPDGSNSNSSGRNEGGEIPRPPRSVFSLGAVSTEEKRCFEWFKGRTSAKLPGIFLSAFWDALVFQACVREPAVLHAVLALSAVHMEATLEGGGGGEGHGNTSRGRRPHQHDATTTAINHHDNRAPDGQERFMLRQYSKAIRCLQPYFAAPRSQGDREATHIALITCVVFICLEFFRSHYQTAQRYLQTGLKLLRESQARFVRAGVEGRWIPRPSRELIDERIVEVLGRLQVQVQLLHQSGGGRGGADWDGNKGETYDSVHAAGPPLSPLGAPKLAPLGERFESVNQARRHLDGVLDAVLFFAAACRQAEETLPTHDTSTSPSLLCQQTQIQETLDRWRATYERSADNLSARLNLRSRFAYRLLHVYWTMAWIMSCAAPSATEQVYDAHTPAFSTILTQIESLISWTPAMTRRLYGYYHPSASYIADLGFICPLYYTALRCRVPSLRRRALTLLQQSPLKEGIWDAGVARAVAHRVIAMEQQQQSGEPDADADLPNWEEDDVSQESAVPNRLRLRDVRVCLPEDPREPIRLSFQRGPEHDGEEHGVGSWVSCTCEL